MVRCDILPERKGIVMKNYGRGIVVPCEELTQLIIMARKYGRASARSEPRAIIDGEKIARLVMDAFWEGHEYVVETNPNRP
jgi:DUF4097 and DUF4098 domain-containing protein YvlB